MKPAPSRAPSPTTQLRRRSDPELVSTQSSEEAGRCRGKNGSPKQNMRAPRLVLIWGFLTGVAAGLASAAPPSSIVEPVGEARDAASFTFRVNTPALLLSNLPDGSTPNPDRRTCGHRVSSRGSRPSLQRRSRRHPRRVTPRARPRKRRRRPHAGRVPAAGREEYRHAVHPTRPMSPKRCRDSRPSRKHSRARLRVLQRTRPVPAIGRPRSVRSAPSAISVTSRCVIAPVRFDPTLRGLRVARALTVTIAFDGDTGVRSISAPDPRIEDLYRDMFANYGQGTTFRLEPAPRSVSRP